MADTRKQRHNLRPTRMPGHGKQIHWHCIRQGCSYVDNGGQVFVMGICPKPADLKPF